MFGLVMGFSRTLEEKGWLDYGGIFKGENRSRGYYAQFARDCLSNEITDSFEPIVLGKRPRHNQVERHAQGIGVLKMIAVG